MIARWVDNGVPQGNLADMPTPREFPDDRGWTIGEPDWIVSSPEFTVKAVESDWHGYLDPSPTGMAEGPVHPGVEVHEVRVQGPKGRSNGRGEYSTGHHMGITASVPGADVSQQPLGLGGASALCHCGGARSSRPSSPRPHVLMSWRIGLFVAHRPRTDRLGVL